MTSVGRDYPTRINISFMGKKGQVVLDQIRTVDKKRLVKVLGKIDEPTAGRVLETLAEMFAP
jgi:mRNA interferase MazF